MWYLITSIPDLCTVTYFVGWYISHFYSISNRIFCKQRVQNVASDLGMHCLPICPIKRTLGVYGIKDFFKKSRLSGRYQEVQGSGLARGILLHSHRPR